MIATIRGTVAEKNIDSAVIETAAGLGFTVQMPASMLDHLPAGGDVKLYTVMAVREDDVSLYGFPGREELDMFKLLLTVNKVGPKVALSILSALTVDDLRFAILSEDAKAITRAPGVGNRVAAQIILSLKDKVDLQEAFESRSAAVAAQSGAGMSDAASEAVQALTALGYSGTEALKAVKSVEGAENMTVEEILKASLRFFV